VGSTPTYRETAGVQFPAQGPYPVGVYCGLSATYPNTVYNFSLQLLRLVLLPQA